VKQLRTATPWLVALALTAFFYFSIYGLQSQNKSAAAINMPDMGMHDMAKFWAFPIMQSAGLTALIMAWFSVALGLAQASARTMKTFGFDIDKLHRHLGLIVLGLAFAHAFVDVWDAMGDSFLTNFWFNGWAKDWPPANLAYNLGVLSFYLLLLLAPTFYLRKKIGERTWRYAHRFVLLVYVMSVWHTLALGADVAYYGWVRPFIWLAQLPLLWWFAQRMKQIASKASTKPIGKVTGFALQYLSYIAIAGIIYLVVTRQYLHFVETFQTAPSIW
jgi:methionine sulfoxide reductase heme-binding subunit